MGSFEVDVGFEVRGHVVFDVDGLCSVRDLAKDTASFLSSRGFTSRYFFVFL